MDERLDQVARKLREGREKTGLSYGKLRIRLMPFFGDSTPSDQTLTNYHEAKRVTWDGMDAVLVAAILNVYGMTVNEVSEDLVDRLRPTRDLLLGVIGCMLIEAGQAA